MSHKSDIELVAPAGEADACYAALHYGADAVYLGLPAFSARADAINIPREELGGIIAYAHSLEPRRRIYVTVNTLVMDRELPEAVELLARIADLGADAVIVQDLGVARFLREHVPGLRLHASTQMAVHNIAGAQALASLGFKRAVLARELTLDEVRDIAANAGLETEVFIHGALCYSYSGLCLFSSFFRGRSGNRGRCSQPCRSFFKQEEQGMEDGYAFSMKDLALGESTTALRGAGVTALKIEGRMKSPLYVATAVDYYRRLLDGKLSEGEAVELQERMQTVFARPWTKLYFDSRAARDVADRDTAGHRGVHIGKVEAVRKLAQGQYALRFRTRRHIEKRDGLQVDVPGRGRPFGFSVDDLRLVDTAGRRGTRSLIEAPAGSLVEVLLPPEHADVPAGAPVYCASSQEVKRSYRFPRPKPGEFGARHAISVIVTVHEDRIEASACAADGTAPRAAVSIAGAFTPARETARTEEAARAAFGKLGDTILACEQLECRNPKGLFVPVSRFNELRRKLCAGMESGLQSDLQARISELTREATELGRPSAVAEAGAERWAMMVDRIGNVSKCETADWAGLDEVVVDIRLDAMPDLEAGLAALEKAAGHDRIRLALPIIARASAWTKLSDRVGRLWSKGWTRWQASNFYGLRLLADMKGADISADWPLYVTNRLTALQLKDLGITRFTLSPEDGRENMGRLLREFGGACTVIVYQDTPLFISATCARANLAGGKCARCGAERKSLRMQGSTGERVLALSDQCGTVVVPEPPFSLADKLADLRDLGASSFRADFIWRAYEPSQVRDLWRAIRHGRGPAGSRSNYERGLA